MKKYPIWIILGICISLIASLYFFTQVIWREDPVAQLGGLILSLSMHYIGGLCIWIGVAVYEKEKSK